MLAPRRTAPLALAVIGAVVGVGALTAGASSGEPASTPATSEPQDASASAPAETLPAAPSETLPAGATRDELLVAGAALFGPTDDAAGELSVFAPVPAGIPTPEDAELVGYSVYIYPESIGGYFNADVSFTTAATVADIVTFYQTMLTAAGYPQTGDYASSDSLGRARTLTFRNPNSDRDIAEIEVTIVDTPSTLESDTTAADDSGDDEYVSISYTDAATADLMAPFTAWGDEELPLPPGGEPAESSIVGSTAFGGPVITLGIDYRYPNVDPAGLEEQFDSALPTAGYEIDDAGANEDGFTEMTGDGVLYANANFTSDFEGATALELTVAFELES